MRRSLGTALGIGGVTMSGLPGGGPGRRIRFRKPVGPVLRILLTVVFALAAVLGVNSVYLVSVRLAEWRTGEVYQNWFYLNMFLLHLVLGFALIVPVVAFGIGHMRNTIRRPNRRAVRMGVALFITALIVLISGVVLTRIELPGLLAINVKDQSLRSAAYWVHVLAPVAAVWMYVLHRLAGRRIRWKLGLTWAAVAGVFAVAMVMLHSQDPRAWNQVGPDSGEQYFFPSLARTATGNFIPADVLDNDEYCLECHADIHDTWSHSVHRFSSFNNPPYLFSVKETRRVMMQREGSVQPSRWCAGCHDPVPFFSGQFDHPKFDDPEYDLASDATAQAGITCTVCHSISHINSVKGNADYTITEPIHYPFASSDSAFQRWVNRQLVKAKPEFHKATFLKPQVHQSAEFCGACHKVHLPPELNDYKWLRGQNHYDAFWLSGVSGQGITSFYYPPQAETNCNQCHMPLMASDDFGASRSFDDSGRSKVHDHMFPSANTAIPQLVQQHMRDWEGAIAKHRAFLDGVMRVDLFGVREGGRIVGELHAPLRPNVPALTPGSTYLFEVVIRTVKMGHLFTQGTADSNQVWLDVTAHDSRGVIGRSGGRRPRDNAVDPWSHFVNAFVIDRHGNRINRRNAQDIFVALYNNQIPPGAANVVHYLLRIPENAVGPITLDVKLQYRKFDTEYMRLVHDDPDTEALEPYINDLPVTELARDTVQFPLAGQTPAGRAITNETPAIPRWQRWNDYGIGLLRSGQLRQAGHAFEMVEQLERPDGPLNLVRVFLEEGLVDVEAPAALRRANRFGQRHGEDRAAPQWTVLWLGALVDKQNGRFDAAIDKLTQIEEGGFEQAAGRGFDFSKDYRLLNELADAYYQRALFERRGDRRPQRLRLMRQAEHWYSRALEYDPENAAAHYGLHRVYEDLGDDERSATHAALHATYKIDDNARDAAIAAARRKYPAANHAAEDVVIHDLQRDGAYGFAGHEQELARHE